MKKNFNTSRMDSVLARGKKTRSRKLEGRKIVSINKIVEDPKNERKTFRNLEDFAVSIKKHGIIEPLIVFEKKPDTYQIISGHRRFRSAKMAGLKQVEIIIRGTKDSSDIRQKSIISNIQREDVNPVELAEGLKELLKEPDIKNQRELGAVIGKPEYWVSTMLKILSLSSTLKKKLVLAQVPISYLAVADIARLKKEEEKQEYIDKLISGVPGKEVRKKIRESKGGGRKTSSASKPKQAYNTKHDTVVIIQSKTETISSDQIVNSLKEALQIARKDMKKS